MARINNLTHQPLRPVPAIGSRAVTAAYGEACLGIGGCELAGAERTGRRLIALNPLRESGYRLVMQSLAQRGNLAEALRVYEQARAARVGRPVYVLPDRCMGRRDCRPVRS